MNHINILQTALNAIGIRNGLLNKVAARIKTPPEFYPWFERNRKKIETAIKNSHETQETINIEEPIIFKNPYGFHPAGKEFNDKIRRSRYRANILIKKRLVGSLNMPIKLL